MDPAGRRQFMAAAKRGLKIADIRTNFNSAANIGLTFYGCKAKDLLLAFLTANSWTYWDTLSGWTQPSAGVSTAKPGSSLQWLSLAADGNAGGTFTPVTSGLDYAGTGLRIPNAQIDGIGGFASRSGAGDFTLPSITLSKPGLLIAAIYCEKFTYIDGGPTPGAYVLPPVGMEELALNIYSSPIYPVTYIYTQRIGAGATGTRTFTVRADTVVTPGVTKGQLIGVIPA